MWRVVPGMVLTQSVDGDPGAGVAELTGVAALVWVTLDEPYSEDEMAAALGMDIDASAAATLRHAITQLLQSGHLRPA